MSDTPDLDATHVRRLAEGAGLAVDASDAAEYAEATTRFLGAITVAASLPDPEPETGAARPHRRPAADENPLGAWRVVSSIRERAEGRLAGKTIAIKDNTCVAGLPLTGGTSVVEGFVPDEDATVVARVLAEGAEIAGIARCEYFSASGGSHTGDGGPVHNPHRRGHTSGGSSSGCGALVGAGAVDLALGCDQGGSIRVPASFCGIVGLKPTWGLVPYTGILSIDPHLDHVGPMTRTVEDNALLLEVIAGADGSDVRQAGATSSTYTEALDADVRGLRVGVLREGFGGCDPGVAAQLEAAAERLRARGATVEEVSIPAHLAYAVVTSAFVTLGGIATMRNAGYPNHDLSPIPRGLPEAFAAAAARSGEFPPNVKAMWLAHAEIERRGDVATIYARLKRQRAAIRRTYDAALSGVDALLMPTTTIVAPPICDGNASVLESIDAIGQGMQNTAQFDVTGHPALSVPCGLSEGLPVGAMLVGRYFEETTLYRLGQVVFDEAVGRNVGAAR